MINRNQLIEDLVKEALPGAIALSCDEAINGRCSSEYCRLALKGETKPCRVASRIEMATRTVVTKVFDSLLMMLTEVKEVPEETKRELMKKLSKETSKPLMLCKKVLENKCWNYQRAKEYIEILYKR